MLSPARLSPITNDLWEATGNFNVMALPVPHRMTVVGLPDGTLMLHSPCPYSVDLANEILEIARITHIVAPSFLHSLGLNEWLAAFPDAVFHAPEGMEKHIRKCPKYRPLTAQPDPAWQAVLSHHPIEGMPKVREVAMLHHLTDTLIVADLAFNFQSDAPLLLKPVLSLTGVARELSISRLYASFIKESKAFHRSVDALLKKEFTRLVPGHGHIVYDDARNDFERAYVQFFGDKAFDVG